MRSWQREEHDGGRYGLGLLGRGKAQLIPTHVFSNILAWRHGIERFGLMHCFVTRILSQVVAMSR